MTTVGERAVTYRPRAIGAIGVEQTPGGWTVKHYGISALRDTPPEPVRAMGRLAVARSLPREFSGALRQAYCVLHEDQDGCYAVVGWWSPNRVILHSRTWLADWDELAAPRPAGGHATACVWELLVMAHERDAWLRHVIRPAQPDLDAYRADVLAPGRY
ncbi:hypothetical protein [Actinoplanes siamensis]|uniref:Uncharacterized protein n=1 Tax=Actinoplanes siamensis TaxID=1223317 RepID=A0A919TMB5_9ACTN|nr:hypothetical protein [Actinoplanes siamensis]GIF07103.1 hypothetical protein Asi03nite_46410 [Actinoplanes siamensis]